VTVPQFLRDTLAAPPKHKDGQSHGVHQWLFQIGRQLHIHCSESEIIRLLKEATRHCGRTVPYREIEEAVAASAKCAWSPKYPDLYHAAYPGVPLENLPLPNAREQTPVEPKWPKPDPEAIVEITATGPGLYDLWECSPLRLDGEKSHSEEIIDTLFPANPLLCCGRSQSLFNTRSREEWRGRLSALSLIAPNPMMTKTGPRKKDGKQTQHSLYATARRIYLFCEFDHASADEAAAIIWRLSDRLPLVLVLHSGGKSLHGWFAAFGRYESDLRAFMKHAVWLGACTSTWTRSQFCRMPDGTRRENGARQVTYYFNPQQAVSNG